MGKLGIVLLVIAIVLVVTMVVLYFLGKGTEEERGTGRADESCRPDSNDAGN